MEELAERIGECCNLLEDARDEQDWDLVQEIIDKLDDLYEELERSSFGEFDLE
jgi:hypothetical protein